MLWPLKAMQDNYWVSSFYLPPPWVVPLFKRIGLGSVVGYLAAGLIIGPFGLQLINDPHTIIDVAELGVVMFLFVIGLDMKPSHLWDLRRQITGAAGGVGSMLVQLARQLTRLTVIGTASRQETADWVRQLARIT
jgi:glutathione-regulated potassium-efflux system ancillary protein KefC/glutathione-regulated potassium-efflux system protein KefB